jgi:hypothetical protein
MGRKRYRDDDDDSRGSLASGVLDALGHGLVLAGLGLAMVALLGSSAGITRSLGTIVIAGGMGTACMLGAFAIREKNDACEPESEQARQHVEMLSLEAARPLALETEINTSEDRRVRYAAMIDQQRHQQSTGRGAS